MLDHTFLLHVPPFFYFLISHSGIFLSTVFSISITSLKVRDQIWNPIQINYLAQMMPEMGGI